ncbi:hypothetical protein [Pseudomonas aeruginosa]|uniref:hypothetical protein n=1 Tax=Pseudomonas aeruginosa TaxID=287 RepID=UPI00053E0263|nr:hypothetical protein [Pseudomonas aeruginosa]
MNYNNRNNQIQAMIAETQFDAYVLGYIAKARANSVTDESLRIEAEGSAMLAGLVSDSCRKRRNPNPPFPYLLLQIAHEALDRTKSNLAKVRDTSRADLSCLEILNQAVWDTAVAMDNISEFVEPDQGSVNLIKKLVKFAQNSGIKEGQALALQALAILGVNYDDSI